MRSARRVALVLGGVLTTAALVASCTSGGTGRTGGQAQPAELPSVQRTTGSSVAGSSASSPPVAPARPVRTPCDRNEQRKWVFVSLQRQHMWMCGKHRVAADTAITSGMAGVYTHTPTGRYHIQGLNRDSVLTLNTGATYPVKFWIPFDAPLFGFHDSSWQHFPYGSPKYKTQGSHGCVHMPLRAIRFLYDWADIGTPVRIKA